MARESLPAPRWWTMRRAQNRKPVTYTCLFCHRYLPGMSDHVLVIPEGDPARRRHAHAACAARERAAGRLPARSDWLRTQPKPEPWWRRAVRRRTPPGPTP